MSGERNFKNEVKEEDYYKVETSFGKFQRSLTLPIDADSSKMKTDYRDGVLTITIPKKINL
nr:Hsp20/alpha crystallin family protein [Sulfurimonas gotlandica]